MKKVWMLVLLVSLGLNLGFGLRMMKDRGGSGERGHFSRGEQSRRFQGRWADRDSVERRDMFNRRVDRIADTLGLDSAQREVFRRVHAETGRLLMRKRTVISEKRDLLQGLVTSEVVDQDRIRAAIAELGQEQAVLDSLVAETVLQEMAVLDPDQRGRYLEMLSFDKQGHGRARGRGGRGSHRQ
jgi:Spy/CpxP family protein refolding chaperone